MRLIEKSEVKLKRRIEPVGFSDKLKQKLRIFDKQHDLVELYKKYSWGKDTWENGFPCILELEKDMVRSAKNNLVKREDILRVAVWGNLRNRKRIECPEIIPLSLYDERVQFNKKIKEDPSVAIRILKDQNKRSLKGLGATYLSKILRFAVPSEFGAIDTRIVRVVGIGNPVSKQQSWLSLKVRNDGYGWYIPSNQPAWPKEYGTWIRILRRFVSLLNDSGRDCPHPEPFYKNNGLRQKGVWVCADVEMALFSYAYKHSKQLPPDKWLFKCHKILKYLE